LFAAALAPAVLFGACGGGGSDDGEAASADSVHIPVTISDEGCTPSTITAKAGKTAFDVTNDGSASVIEFYVKKANKVLGEVENVLPGSPKTLTLTLKAGTFTIECPNGTKTERGTLTVTPS